MFLLARLDVHHLYERREMILVVEDEPGVRALVEYALKRNGYSVISAECGSSAVESFSNARTRSSWS